jgi:YfiH family protein
VLRSARLTDAGFRHGFTTRRGGVSPEPFATFHFGLPARGDEPPSAPVLRDRAENIRANVERLAQHVGFAPDRLFQVNQVHGARAVWAKGRPDDIRAEAADALLARLTELVTEAEVSVPAIGVRTADCVPILIGDRKTGAVAAIHAGWRGVVSGVVASALEALRASDAHARPIAAIGPCIEACCFEVGEDVAKRIVDAVGDASIAGRPTPAPRDERPDKRMVDLRRAVRAQLRSLGVEEGDIEDVGGCTRCDASLYFSYRRDGEVSGRHLSVIVPRAASSARG